MAGGPMSDDAQTPDALKKSPYLTLAIWWLPIVSAVVVSLWSAFVYARDQANLQRTAETNRRLEVQRPFLERQLALYFEVVQIAGELVTPQGGEEAWGKHERRFWQLYWAELSMVEAGNIEQIMVEVGKKLQAYKEARQTNRGEDQLQDLRRCVYELAHEVRRAIEIRWHIDAPDAAPRRCSA